MNDSKDVLLPLLGLSEYEGRLYRALLSESPSTAYRLGKLSGVPLSRVYEMANRLVEKGAAVRGEGEPATYSPVPPDTLVNAARSRTTRQLDALEQELASLYAGVESPEHVWLQGESQVLDRVGALAISARSDLLVCCTAAALSGIRPALKQAEPRVAVQVISAAPTQPDAAPLSLVADGKTALIGHLGKHADALVTNHPVLVRLAVDHARLRAAVDSLADRARVHEERRWMDWEEEKQRRLLRADAPAHIVHH